MLQVYAVCLAGASNYIISVASYTDVQGQS